MAKVSVRCIVDDVDAAIDFYGRVESLSARGRRPRGDRRPAAKDGARFRNDIVTGVGGKQILVEDPAGNPIELFEPTIREAKL